MSTFYIHVRGPNFEAPDLVGQDLPDSEAARAEALKAARAILAEEVSCGKMPAEWIEVEDEDHRPVMTVPLISVAP